MTSFNSFNLLIGPIAKYSHIRDKDFNIWRRGTIQSIAELWSMIVYHLFFIH